MGILPEAYDAWKYVKGQLVDFGKGTMIPTEWGGGDKAWWADAWYCGGKPAAGTRTGRELLRRGYLNDGGLAGPSCVNGNNGLTNAWWNILATISVYKKFDTRPHKPAEEAYTWEYPKYVIKGHSFLMK